MYFWSPWRCVSVELVILVSFLSSSAKLGYNIWILSYLFIKRKHYQRWEKYSQNQIIKYFQDKHFHLTYHTTCQMVHRLLCIPWSLPVQSQVEVRPKTHGWSEKSELCRWHHEGVVGGFLQLCRSGFPQLWVLVQSCWKRRPQQRIQCTLCGAWGIWGCGNYKTFYWIKIVCTVRSVKINRTKRMWAQSQNLTAASWWSVDVLCPLPCWIPQFHRRKRY